MSCYHPCLIERIVDKVTGDVDFKFISSKQVEKIPFFNSIIQDVYAGKSVDGFNPKDIFKESNNRLLPDYIKIPCGKCIGCRIDYSRSWADRMTYHSIGREEKSYFLTLTYDDNHLSDLDHSDSGDIYSLNYDDMSLFIKRLRYRFPPENPKDSLDYYYSGEYGDNSFRPHYHMIAYNLFIPDLKFWKLNSNGDPLYTSNIIDNLWGKGFVCIGKFSWLNSAYCAQYVEKKRDGRAMIEYTAVGLEPEKCRCSRRPGIANDYYLEHHTEIWKNEGLSVPRQVNANGKLGIPRYFRKLALQKDEDGHSKPDLYEMIDYQKRVLDRSNIVNPQKIDNSSFDLNRVNKLLEFEEREVLRRKSSRDF